MCWLITLQAFKGRAVTWYHLSQTLCVGARQYHILVTFAAESCETCGILLKEGGGGKKKEKKRRGQAEGEGDNVSVLRSSKGADTLLHMCISLSAWILLSRCWGGSYGRDYGGKKRILKEITFQG